MTARSDFEIYSVRLFIYILRRRRARSKPAAAAAAAAASSRCRRAFLDFPGDGIGLTEAKRLTARGYAGSREKSLRRSIARCRSLSQDA